MQIYGCELLAVFNHPDKSCHHNFCNSGDIILPICHVTAPEHMLIGYCEFMSGSPSW